MRSGIYLGSRGRCAEHEKIMTMVWHSLNCKCGRIQLRLQKKRAQLTLFLSSDPRAGFTRFLKPPTLIAYRAPSDTPSLWAC
jgi:hypothetical protein